MSVSQAFGPPPLPAGWTEHTGPSGQPYYHNAQTSESTYVRPLPSFLNLPQAFQPTKKKEKPRVKTPIPGTEWLRVITTEGNVFYTHKVKKESLWTVPEEIKAAVDTLEKEEAEKKEREEREAIVKKEEDAERAEKERLAEIERIKSEVQEAVKRKAEDAPVDELIISKKARVGDDEDGDEDDDGDDESEEDWQREAAAQLAAEADGERKRLEEEAKREKEEAEEQSRKAKEALQLNMPARVDLSIEEAKALFKTLLHEKDINPLHPWDNALPLFISDPRYVLLPSVSARREAFDEYCRDRARELRQSNVKKEKDLANPKEAYERLLKEEVKSTRTSWTDFRRTWKKDRRFWGWGRDDREREKRFREHLKDLGEKKRAAAQKAEVDFFDLLKGSGLSSSNLHWKDVKRKISNDPRYDAVGSSSLREELFSTFLKAQVPNSPLSKTIGALDQHTDSLEAGEAIAEADDERKRREKKERAVKEREEKIKTERGRVEADIGRSRQGLDKEEGERDFRTMLTDAIRDPRVTWDEAIPQLKTDPRLTRSPLPLNQQIYLFNSHVAQLRSRHLHNLHTLFLSHSPSLATPFSAMPLSSLLSALPATKLGYNAEQLEYEYEKWQRERRTEARQAFDHMLGENAFVEFWGRLGKIGGEGVEGGVAADDLGEDEGEGGGGKVDMKALAKSVDLKEMDRVLKNDKRYLMFDHVPEQRERWLRDYLSQLSAPKLSVHLKDQHLEMLG